MSNGLRPLCQWHAIAHQVDGNAVVCEERRRAMLAAVYARFFTAADAKATHAWKPSRGALCGRYRPRRPPGCMGRTGVRPQPLEQRQADPFGLGGDPAGAGMRAQQNAEPGTIKRHAAPTTKAPGQRALRDTPASSS